ncbi:MULTISPECIES: hypothetical protein [unclassified Flavobacterium]|uniref:hypothetical protein n=1 Tax=unclassified Flavobacterium TaxID=196869 RepID=UPI003617DB1D
MKLRLLVTTIILSITQSITAQKNATIVGLYQEKGVANGEKTSIYILKDNTFAITGYGTLISGTWAVSKDKITLTPIHPQTRFELYGRHNPKVKKGCKIMFQNFEKAETFVGYETNKVITLQRVFNTSPNCLKFPNVHKFNTKVDLLSFSANVTGLPETKDVIYDFKIDNDFNEFIAYYVEIPNYYKPVVFTIKKEGLQMVNEKEILKKSNFKPKDLTDLKAIQESAAEKSISREVLYVNPSYNILGSKDINLEDYTFNEKKNEFNHKINKTDKEALYQDVSLVFKYEKVKTVNVIKSPFKINETNLFTAKCTEKGKEIQ